MDAGVGQVSLQDRAVRVVADLGRENGLDIEPGKADGDIERRPTGVQLTIEHIDQGFADDQDRHRLSRSIVSAGHGDSGKLGSVTALNAW